MSPTAGEGTRKRNWGIFICGIAMFLIGLILLFWPELTMETLAAVLGVLLVVEGIVNIIVFFVFRKRMNGSGWVLANGILSVILGLLFAIHPLVAAEVIVWFAALLIIVFGIYGVVAGIFMTDTGSFRVLMILGGIVSVLFGILFLTLPDFFEIVLAVFLMVRGIALAISGVVPTSGITNAE